MFNQSLTITALSSIGYLISLIVQVLIARIFGTGIAIDAYFYALSIPIFLGAVVCTALIHGVTPLIVEKEREQQECARLKLTLTLIGIGCAMLMILLGLILAPIQSSYFLDNINNADTIPLDSMILLGWIIGAAQVIAGVNASILNAERRFYVAIFLSFFPYIGMTVGLILSLDIPSIILLSMGMALGQIAYTIVGLIVLRKSMQPYSLFALHYKEVATIIRKVAAAAFALTCFTVYAVVDAFWAPRMGESALSIVGYSQRVIQAFGNITVVGIYTIAGPRFTETLNTKGLVAFRKEVFRFSSIAVASSSLLAVLLYVFVDYIVALLFGTNIEIDERTKLASVIRFMLPGMICMLTGSVVMKALFCLKNTLTISLIIGCGWTMGYFTLASILYEFGVVGLALGYSITWTVLLLVIVLFVFSRTPESQKV